MIIFGASGHGKVIADILLSNGIADLQFWDHEPKAAIWGYQVSKPNLSDNAGEELVIGIGNNIIRKKVAEELKPNIAFGKAKHATAVISNQSTIGEGTVVMANSSVNCDTNIGSHVILNTNCSVDHDCVIHDYAHISPNASLAGNVEVGEGTHIGIGACVIQGVKIGKWATIGAGAVVINEIPDYAVAVGNPAKVIKYNKPGNNI